MEQLSSMPLRLLWIALLLGTAVVFLPALGWGAGPLFFAASRSEPIGLKYVGVIGEVTRPGVYEIRSGGSLAELIIRTGGITSNANGSVRVIRGGRVAEQVFLSSDRASVLFSGDLVSVERQRSLTETPTRSVREKSNADNSSSEVQVAFLNVLDRPVVVKMAAEQATIERIVRLLGQPNDLCTSVRVIGPSGTTLGRAGAQSAERRPLESGTAIVFAPKTIGTVFLPAFPAPIAEAPQIERPTIRVAPIALAVAGKSHPEATSAPSDGLPLIKAPELPPAAVLSHANPDCSRAECNLAKSNVEIQSPSNPRRQTENRTDAAAFEASQQERKCAHGQHDAPVLSTIDLRRPKGSQRPALVALVCGMSLMAACVMVFTLVSMVRRLPSTRSQGWSEFVRRVRGITLRPANSRVPPAPLPSRMPRVGRPVRIDARQPMTKLSIDLAVLERSTSGSR